MCLGQAHILQSAHIFLKYIQLFDRCLIILSGILTILGKENYARRGAKSTLFVCLTDFLTTGFEPKTSQVKDMRTSGRAINCLNKH